jgi:hypothetical protein
MPPPVAGEDRERLEHRYPISRRPAFLGSSHVDERVADRRAPAFGDQHERVRLGEPFLVERAPLLPRLDGRPQRPEFLEMRRHGDVVFGQ